ncbi:methyltransferase [Sphaerisporangium sp. TRM90804]|uniref:methyltransferase n=1 Tax=Sphaerisporangium sp. TRM90804 TaxID=3031113 RepID=UPI00244C5DE4|nr:methyltransferase [Sphaerisporangium sp. TRM90804]MDH2427098.1 methyltransferase [Sphaerisporangium sp. TRM90804]
MDAETTGAGYGDSPGVDGLLAMCDLVSPLAIRVAATLRLPDLLGSGCTEIADLARKSGTEAGALLFLMRYLVGKGLFTEPAAGHFELTSTGRALTDDHPSRLRASLDLNGTGGRFDLAYTGLLDTIRTGRAAYPQVFGRSLWDDLAASPYLSSSFDSMMTTMAAHWAPDVVTRHRWDDVRHVADVGGGAGDLLIELLTAHPEMRGTLTELPATAAKARDALARAGLRDRCEVVAGSFFDSVPKGADVYVLAHVLHNWPDPEALEILRRCAEAAGPRGRLLIVDRLCGDGTVSYPDAAVNLHMLVVFGSKERTLAQFTELVQAAGLRIGTVEHTPSGSAHLSCLPAEAPSGAASRP